jgi:hypothetical protein
MEHSWVIVLVFHHNKHLAYPAIIAGVMKEYLRDF